MGVEKRNTGRKEREEEEREKKKKKKERKKEKQRREQRKDMATVGENIRVILHAAPLNLQEMVVWATLPECGAVATFIGTTRNEFEGRTVLRLEYEAYEPMALKQLQRLAEEALSRWPELRRVGVAHRLGPVAITEASVVIVACSPHRSEALECVQWAIDELKAVVPIWKSEVYQDGDRIWKENKECKHARRHGDVHLPHSGN